MRDGTILRADIYRPASPGTYPVIVSRTPHGKQSDGTGMLAVPRGIVYVVQDCRGRFASAGQWYPFRVEPLDGFDRVEWATHLFYSNGRVALYGGSYAGATALLAATAQPPHLVAVAVIEAGLGFYDGWAYRGGVLQQNFVQTWASVLTRSAIPASKGGVPRRREPRLIRIDD